METYYAVVINGRTEWRGTDLETAARLWDRLTCNRDGLTPGGIRVESHAGGMMIRDGWLLRVQPDGFVYLNPTIGAEPADSDPRCPACGEPADYCQGHGTIGDPAGAATLAAHDNGEHSGCHPAGCEEAGA